MRQHSHRTIVVNEKQMKPREFHEYLADMYGEHTQVTYLSESIMYTHATQVYNRIIRSSNPKGKCVTSIPNFFSNWVL
jgi:hypothetical protein